ncbi:O-antigen ligase family protein [bacterium]|nr:O-antigen ligase family protein [bacterium]
MFNITPMNRNILLLLIVIDIVAVVIGVLPTIWAAAISVAIFGLIIIVNFPLIGISIFLVGSFLFSYFLGESQLITIVIVIICLTGITIYYINRDIPYSGIRNDFATLSFLLFSGLIVSGFFYTPNTDYAISKIYRYAMFNSLAFMVPFIFHNDQRSLKKLYDNIFYVALGLVLLSSILILTSNKYSSTRFNMSGTVNPIWIARVIGVGILISLYKIQFYRDDMTKRMLYIVFIMMSLWIMVLTGSRAPLISVFISSVILVLYIVERSRKTKFLTAFGSLFLAISLLFMIPTEIMVSKYSTIGSRVSTLQRFALWERALEVTGANLFLGKGTGGFQSLSGGFTKYPHNIFLEASSELGLIGLIIMISFILRPLWKTKEIINKQRAFGILIFCLWLFNLLNAQFSGDFTGNYLLWFCVGSWIELSSSEEVTQ